ncbi:MAG: lipoyl(octanoyl) transferase LipB [Gammaproteobacteria bacterium]
MNVVVRHFALIDYPVTLARMRAHVDGRTAGSADEIWLLQHPPVFTQGQAGKAGHVLDPGEIPVVQSDRGGQVTYHGPGQLIAYVMLDLRRCGIGPRELVRRLESAIIALLAELDIDAERRAGAPGVYVGAAKIAALGLRIRRGISFHGLSLNVDADLAPFSRINPCGYRGLAITSLQALGVALDCDAIATRLLPHLAAALYPGAAVELTQRHGFDAGIGDPDFTAAAAALPA